MPDPYDDFDQAFKIVVVAEGGDKYTSPEDAIKRNDLGGETKYGISKRQYPDVDIKNLTEDAAKEIYRHDYWSVCKCDKLPWPLNLYVFDCAINQGCDAKAGFAAQKLLQKTLGVAQDGILGVATMAKAAKARPFHCAAFMANRAQRYIGTRSFDANGDGWFTRLFSITQGGCKNGDV